MNLSPIIQFRRAPIQFLQGLGDRYGDIAKFRLGTFDCFFLNHPALIREVLATQKDNFPKLGRHTKTIRSVDGESLFVTRGNTWLQMRKLVQASLHRKRFQQVADIVREETAHVITRFKSGDSFAATSTALELAIRVSGRTLLGDCLEEHVPELIRLSEIRADVFTREMGQLVRLPDHWPLPMKRKKREFIRWMDRLLFKLIKERREHPRDDLISHLVQAQPEYGFSDQEIRDNLNMMFHAGVDDMGTAILWMFAVLSQHPEVQRSVRDEVSMQSGVGGESVQGGAPSDFELCERVVKESLRMYPSTWIFTARSTRKPVLVGEYLIPAKSWIFISPFVTQNDARFFESPTSFDPDRFQRHKGGSPVDDAWFPFGIGPRACAGGHFSILILKQVLVAMMKSFELYTEGSIDFEPVAKVTIRPKVDPVIFVR